MSPLRGQPDGMGREAGKTLASAAAGRLDAQLGYGLTAPKGQGRLKPYARVALTEGGERAWHLGTRLALTESLNFSLEASRWHRHRDGFAHAPTSLASLDWYACLSGVNHGQRLFQGTTRGRYSGSLEAWSTLA